MAVSRLAKGKAQPYGAACMSTLAEIESAADTLSAPEKQELLLFLAARLQASGAELPSPRRFTREQVAAWVTADETE